MIGILHDKQGEPRIHGSTAHGSTWKNFRVWLFFGSKVCLNLEWVIKRNVTPAIGVSVGTGDVPEITIWLGIPFLISIWFTLESVLLKPLTPTVRTKSVLRPGELWDMPITRFTGAYVFDGRLRVFLWADQDIEFNNQKWQQFIIRLWPKGVW